MTNASGPRSSNTNQTALEAARSRNQWPTRANVPQRRAGRDTPIGFSYLRVSTKDQARTGGGAEGYSIPAQRDACRAKAAGMGVLLEPQYEYVDAGESARSADRDQLQQMLADIKTVKPDYVFVHKIDRLARNRADDIAINFMLKKHGVTLISCTENIDDTPSGRLLYGLMAEIAQFYSSNLALEVMKGSLRKAEEGGTPFRAPLGYLNRRERRGNVELSWVEWDPERAELVRWCLVQYATGEWSAIDLTLAARAKGLTTRPTATSHAQPISLTTMYHLLANPYYMGVVSYQGIHYEGKHQPLIEPETWLRIQDLLAAHHHTGEKNRTHMHYLRSTIYCSACGGRLVFSRNSGRGGTYDYFMCVKKKTKTNNCNRSAVRVERVEEGIAAFYGRFRTRPEHVALIQAAVREELAASQAEATHARQRAEKRKGQADGERAKLLQAHYAGAIPQDLLATEMQRLTRELAEADTEIAAAKASTVDVEKKLAHALVAAEHCERAYLTAPSSIRRQINQGFFVKLFIDEDGEVARAELTEPFATLLDGRTNVVTARATDADNASDVAGEAPSVHDDAAGQETVATANDATIRTYTNTPRDYIQTGPSLQDKYLVGAAGIEPTTAGLQGCYSTLIMASTYDNSHADILCDLPHPTVPPQFASHAVSRTGGAVAQPQPISTNTEHPLMPVAH